MNMGSTAVGVGVTVMVLILVIVLVYTFKDKITNDTGLNLSNDTQADINSTFNYAKIAFTFLGLGLLVLGIVVVIGYVRSLQ